MLILSRFVNESLYIGDRIRVLVAKIKGDCVNLGIEGPKHIPILREEVARRTQADFAERRIKETHRMEEIEALVQSTAREERFDFPLIFDSIFDAACDFLTIRGAYSLLLEARVKDKEAIYATARALDNTVARLVDLLKRAGYDAGRIAEFTTSLGATRPTDGDFAKGVVDDAERYVSHFVSDEIRRLSEAVA